MHFRNKKQAQKRDSNSEGESSDGYLIALNENRFLKPGSRLWRLCKSSFWRPLKSVLCRLLMIVHSIYVIYDTAHLFNESLIYLNLLFLPMIVIDGLIVVYAREGLEDRWCSFSLLFYICANTTPLYIAEIVFSSLWQTVFRKDYVTHIDSHYKLLSENHVLTKVTLVSNNVTIDTDKQWLDYFNKDIYTQSIGKYESSFCLVLILTRLLLPQATLSWNAIGYLVEYSFNTLFDVYATFDLLRESKYTLSIWLIVINFCICNTELACISLNVYIEESSNDLKAKISPLRNLVENFYFRFFIQILFADLPFLVTRVIIAIKWSEYMKTEIYYSITKQIIIIICKLIVILHHKYTSYKDRKTVENIIKLNNS